MLAAGAGFGTGLFVLAWALVPRRTSALVRLGRFDAHVSGARQAASAALTDEAPGRGPTLRRRAENALVVWFAAHGVAWTSLRQDLALSGRDVETVLGVKVGALAAGILVTAASATGVQAVLGTWLPLGSAGVLALLVGVGLFFVPDLEARREALARRRDFRHVLGSYLDLVALEMAGSAAPAEALPSAARVGSGWPLALIRDTLYRATVSGQDHWDALSELGMRIGVPELQELGAVIRLAGRDGARVRDTLSARAASTRRRELADAESLAGQREQSMRLVLILIATGFILLLIFPATMNVLEV